MTTKRRRGTEHRLRHVGALVPPDGFGTVVSVGMGPDGPIVMWAGGREAGHAAVQAGQRDLGKPGRTVALASYTTSDLHPDRVVVAPVPVAPAFVQPLPDGGYLVARSRCAWTPEGAERNAVVVGTDGRVIARETLGDGIAHLQVDRDGRIWVGYFDEGIAGNNGWRFGGPEPLGSSGLVRWSPSFEKEWEFPTGTGTAITECDAMNVSDDGVIAYDYREEQLIRVRNDQTSIHPTGTEGVRGVVFSDETVGLVGSSADRSLFTTGTLSAESFNQRRRGYLSMPSGKPVPRGLRPECRGSTLNLFDGNDWYQVDLAQSPVADRA